VGRQRCLTFGGLPEPAAAIACARTYDQPVDKTDDGGRVPVDDRPAEKEPTPSFIAAREEADAVADRIGADVHPSIDVVLENCRIALRALAAQHAHLADHSDLDLEGDTRWAARWRLAGAALAYANALVDLSGRGYVDAALPVSRALYEALGVLGVVNDDSEQTILARWLEDREVQPKKVRAAAERQAKRTSEEAAARGIELDVADIREQMEQIYGVLSDVSHVRRSGLRGMVSVPLRRAIYDAHPDPFARAHGAVSTVLAVEATVLGVGDALAAFYGGPYYAEVIKPIQDGLMESAAQLMALRSR
jgi:hypothetical protein